MSNTSNARGGGAVLSARGRQIVCAAVAGAVRRLRRSGIGESELADRFGVTAGTIRRWTLGEGFPSFTQAVRLAPLVGIDAETGRPVS